MRLLAIDTSSAATLIAAADGDAIAVRCHRPRGGERPQHTSAALVLAREALAELGLEWRDLERIGAGTGPGSFTGLRSGLAAAAGLARAGSIGLVPVPATLQWSRAARDAARVDGPLLVAVDGRRNELFIERFDAGVAGHGIERHRRDGPSVLGDLSGVTVTGDGALLEREVFTALGGTITAFGDPASGDEQRARALAHLTADGEPAQPGAVLPLYGREPDAVPTVERA